MEQFKVTCLQCKESDNVLIIKGQVQFEKMMATNFLAARFRKDGQWGFECICGNDTRLCKEEADDFERLVYGTPMSLKKLKRALLKRTHETFRMEAV